MNVKVDFDALYAEADPFGYRLRWYEARKRQLLLAMLPAYRYARAWEWGCSNGETTALLAQRCDVVLATDISARAVELARERLTGLDQVNVACMRHPQQWPSGTFDLIVFSEVGYYLDTTALTDTIDRFGVVRGTTTLLACHWKPSFVQAHRNGAAVHAALTDRLGRPSMRYDDEDVVMEVWSPDARSLAHREGLR